MFVYKSMNSSFHKHVHCCQTTKITTHEIKWFHSSCYLLKHQPKYLDCTVKTWIVSIGHGCPHKFKLDTEMPRILTSFLLTGLRKGHASSSSISPRTTSSSILSCWPRPPPRQLLPVARPSPAQTTHGQYNTVKYNIFVRYILFTYMYLHFKTTSEQIKSLQN